MEQLMSRPTTDAVAAHDMARAREDLTGRLGLSVPRGWWAAAPTFKAYEAAGFRWIQVHVPPLSVLRDDDALTRHARALHMARQTSDLRLVLHAPEALSAGSPGHDLAFERLLAYARLTRAELVVYHGLDLPHAAEPLGAQDPAVLEERSLRRLAAVAEDTGVTIAIENLAPLHPGPARRSHSPLAVRDLVRRIGSPSVGMCFDLGHANVVAARLGTDVAGMLDAVHEDVVLFHLHDNLGARRGGEQRPGVDPLRLDLHLAPGAGTVPWDAVAGPLRRHRAPLLLEVHPAHRPEPLGLARITGELLIGRARA